MKKIYLIIILLISSKISAQEFNNKIFFENFVECYYSKNLNEPILIYKYPNGILIHELKPLINDSSWYKFAISESKSGWLKIENILILPECNDRQFNNNFEQYKGNWILAKNLKINISDLDVESRSLIKFFENPNLNSNIVYKSDKFLETELIEIIGLWAKVNFVINGVSMSGWLQRKDQCAYPWTSCPFQSE